MDLFLNADIAKRLRSWASSEADCECPLYSAHFCDSIQKFFWFFPSQTRIGNRFAIYVIAADLLVAWFDIAFNHKSFYQSMDFRVNETAVKNLFCNSYLLLVLLVGIGMISIYDYCRIFQIFLLIFFQEETEIFVMIIGNSFSCLLTAPRRMVWASSLPVVSTSQLL